MQFRLSSLVHAAIGAGAVGAAVLFAQPATDPKPVVSPPATPPTHEDRGQPKLEDGMDEKKMMDAWMALASPGKPHEFLKTLEGNYTTVSRVWMDPKAPPAESSGKAIFKTVLGGRFLQQDYTGSMMNMPMTGMGLMGYDNYRHQYTSTWADSLGTAIYTMTGNISQDGKTITQFGTMDEPTTKQIGKMVKWVTRIVSDDKMFFESWEVETGDPIKVFEVEYTRAK
jgi:hypothetical protein